MANDGSEQTEKKKYKGEATATASEIKEVGGEKTLSIDNYLFQSDIDCQNEADALLARLKSRKDYFEMPVEFCPVPVERDDTVAAEEYVTHEKSIWHLGLIRQVKLSVTRERQALTLILED